MNDLKCTNCHNVFEPDELFEDEQLCIECLHEFELERAESYSYQEND